MEAPVRKSQPALQPPPAPPAEAKLTIEKFADGAITCLKFSGTIDEAFEGKKIARTLECETLVLDLGGVKKISSFGIREWVDFVATSMTRAKSLLLIECAPKVVDQLNMVANFAGGGRVFSFYAPFRCDYCDSEHRVLLEMAKDFEAIKAMKLADRPCPSCKDSMYFDEDGATFFSFVLGQGAFELEPDVVGFLAAKLDYRIGTIDAKLRVDKIIDGRITYLRLAGDLNNSFPRDKLAEGLEGTVIADVTGVARVEPAGAAEWRSFVQQIAPLVEQLYLCGVQPAFLEKLCGKDDLGAKTQVTSFALPYACQTCGTTSGRAIDVAEHHAVLKFATAPELRCRECKGLLACVAGEHLMTILPDLPSPAITKELSSKINELQARKLEKKPSTGIVAVPKVAQERPRTVLPIVLALAIVAVGGVGFMVYQRASARSPGANEVVQRSAATRPAWIHDLGPVTGTCAADGCVGASSPLASQEEAEDEAADTASEAVAWQLAQRVANDKSPLTALYVSARDAAIAGYGRDPLSTQARRELHDGRHAVARALHGAIKITDRYWEAFDTADGRRYLAFARIAIAPAELDRIAARSKQTAAALGATVGDFVPELAWRFPKLDHGAVVIKLEHGLLQDLGLAEHYLVLAVDGRDVVDAAGFAKLVTDEYAQLADHGGALRLLVQTDTGDPREFQTTIEGKHVESPAVPSHRPRGPHDTGSGGVNVWDRFGGSRGSGRDDPTQ